MHSNCAKFLQEVINWETVRKRSSACPFEITARKTLKRKQGDANEHEGRALMLPRSLTEHRPGCSQVQVNQQEQQHLQQQTEQPVMQEWSEFRKQVVEEMMQISRGSQRWQASLSHQHQGQEAEGGDGIHAVGQIDRPLQQQLQQPQQQQQLQNEEDQYQQLVQRNQELQRQLNHMEQQLQQEQQLQEEDEEEEEEEENENEEELVRAGGLGI
uniref:Uncharacterized protein n=1 Tax=Plectus sambesii TaxID=2011161 RepID=A0A914XDQ2_9BILA